MADNSVLAHRCETLMTSIQTLETSIQHVNDNFKDNAKDASAAIDEALQKHGFKTFQDLVDQVAKDMPEKDREQFLKLIRQNKLPSVWEALIGRDTAEHITKAMSFVGVLIVTQGLMQIKNGLLWDMSPAFSYISTMTRASALQVAATEAFAKHVATVADITALQEDIALNEIVGTEATQLRAQLQTALNEELVIAGKSYSLRTAAFEAGSVAAEADAELLAARAAASASIRSGIYGALIGAGLLVGCWLYSKHEEAEHAKNLKDAIRHLATTRVFAQNTLNKALRYGGVMNGVEHVADNYSRTDPSKYQSRLDDLVSDVKKCQVDNLPQAFADAQKQDKDAKPPPDTSEDPKTLKEMEDIHKEMVEKYLKEHPDVALVHK